MMNIRLRLLCTGAVAALTLSACASYPGDIKPGMSLDELKIHFGTPSAQRRDAAGETVIYTTQPMGQFAWAAQLGADQRVVKVEQILTVEQFARIKQNEWTTAMVRDNFGAPAEINRYATDKLWWSYRYRENGLWPTLMNIRFDAQGVVREMINTPDPLYTPNINDRSTSMLRLRR